MMILPSIQGFLSSEGDRAAALGRLVGFAVGFGIMMVIGIVVAVKIMKKRKK
ncbi:MAG TPA: hypothetical protein VF791_04845 [Pyrinomonadaceae bacterium]